MNANMKSCAWRGTARLLGVALIMMGPIFVTAAASEELFGQPDSPANSAPWFGNTVDKYFEIARERLWAPATGAAATVLNTPTVQSWMAQARTTVESVQEAARDLTAVAQDLGTQAASALLGAVEQGGAGEPATAVTTALGADATDPLEPVNRAMFLRILQEPQGITRTLRLMNQTSVLGRYLWVFRRIVGQMQHDLFHVYTVDQHILMVLRNARRFFMPEHAHEYPFCSQLAAGWDKPWLLYVAALFHDIAKGRGGDHSQLGRGEVRLFCRQHGISNEDAELIEFLVGEHLTMSHVAQKQDLSDPDVIAQFAHKVGHERRLTALYLLTVADIRGTSPKVWNAWKGKLLEDLYRATLRALGGRAPDADAEVESRKRDALTELARMALPHEVHKSLWDTLDVSYFMRHEAADIAWHTRHVSRFMAEAQLKAQTPQTLVRARMSPWEEGLEVMVYTPDQSDLFARICGYFDQAGFSILDARIHTARNGYALDTFQLIAPNLSEHYRELITMIETGLTRTLQQAGPLPPPSRGRVSRRVKSFPVTPRVSLQPDEKAQHWLLSVSASDRTGLLYSIAQVLARNHINLKLAKISTLGERVEDTFLIDGPDLQQNRRQIEIETELVSALQG